MRWDNNIDGPACLLHLACPQVVCGIAAFILGEAHGRRLYGDSFRLPAGVEQTDDRVSVRFLLGEHLVVAGIDNPFRSDRILVNSEDGHLYRWDFTSNSLSPAFPMATATGEAYTPTVMGPDGAVYAINNATLYSCVHN